MLNFVKFSCPGQPEPCFRYQRIQWFFLHNVTPQVEVKKLDDFQKKYFRTPYVEHKREVSSDAGKSRKIQKKNSKMKMEFRQYIM